MKKRKRKKKSNKINTLFAIPLLISSIIFIYALLVLDILVTKYILILLGILLIINITILILLKRKNKKIKIFAIFCSILFSAGLLLASNYIFKTNGILIGSNIEYKTYNFSVLVLKDSKYKNIKDLDNESMGYYEIENIDSNKYLDKIDKKIDISYQKYDTYSNLTDSLTKKEVESIVIEDSYLNMLNEGELSTFNEETRTIYKFQVKVKTDNISKDINVTKEPFNIYISAMDEYGTVSSVSRSDVNIIMTINPKTRQILLTSIPRDYYVQIHGTTGYKDKLTHAGLYGIESSVNTIEDLLDIDINYYIKVNFTSLINIINAIDGVEVYSEYDFTSIDGYHYSKGYNKVNGEEALSFARERKAFSAGDNQRGKNQQALIEAMIRKCTSSSIIYKYNNLLNSIDGSFITNMSSKRITSLVKMQLSNMKSWTVTSNNLTGSDGSAYTYSYSSQKLYVMIPNEDSIEEASDMINEVLDGETLESSYASTSSNVHSVSKSNPINYNQNNRQNNNKKEENIVDNSKSEKEDNLEEETDKDNKKQTIEEETTQEKEIIDSEKDETLEENKEKEEKDTKEKDTSKEENKDNTINNDDET